MEIDTTKGKKILIHAGKAFAALTFAVAVRNAAWWGRL